MPLLLLLALAFAVPASAAELPQLEALVAAAPPLETVQLQRASPSVLTVVDCGSLPDSRKLTMMFLQGLANRGGARLYLRGLRAFNTPADDWWLQRLKTDYGIERRDLSWTDALKEYGAGRAGVVVWDDKQPATENVAAMLAGLLSLVACAPADLEAVKQATGLTVLADLRGLWQDHFAPQRWALANLVPKLPRDDIGCICTRASLQSDPRLCRDWLVMRGGVMVDLSSTRPDERPLKDEFYKQMKPRAIVWGWVTYDGEVPHVEHATISGLQVLCTTNSPNLSVFSQLQPHRTSWRQPHSPAPGPIGRKLYLSFIVSDGDAPPIMQTRYWYRWDEQSRGKLPMGWELQPLLAVLAPILLEYYYETATPQDRFLSAPPYVLPSKLPQPEPFMQMTATLSAACDLNLVYTGNDPINEQTARCWNRCFPASVGYVYGWGMDPQCPPYFYDGRPHLQFGQIMTPPPEHGAPYYDKVAEEIAAWARRWGMPSVLFVHLSNYNAGPDEAARMMQRLQGKPVEVVPADTAMEIARQLLQSRQNPQWCAQQEGPP